METLFFGLAYRLLYDDSSSDPAGYERYSNYFYMPIGLTTTNYINDDGWSIGATGEFDPLLLGYQVSDFGDVEITNRQNPGSGYGLRGAVSLAKKKNRRGWL